MGCAASVRSDLVKIEGISDIELDPNKQVCSFKIPKSVEDYETQLTKFAETNEHLAEFTIQ